MKKIILISSLFFSVLASAQTVKNARSNDVASKYTLKANGDFFRTVGRNECQITNDVDSFKVSQHPKDVAVAYYERGGDLYILKNAHGSNGNCPEASKKVLMENVEKYTVVSTTNTDIVNLALSRSGKLVAWDNRNVLVSEYGIENYAHNDCYGVKGKSFNTIVAFGITYSGRVLKIRGGSSTEVSATMTSEYYSSINNFKSDNNVCK